MLEPQKQADVAVPDYKVWHSRTHGSIDGSAINTRTDRLDPWQTGALEMFGRKAFHRYGDALSGES